MGGANFILFCFTGHPCANNGKGAHVTPKLDSDINLRSTYKPLRLAVRSQGEAAVQQLSTCARL
eukprot:867005-Pyramimonas_sp.AAC.1